MGSLKKFIERNRIRSESVMVDKNPYMDDSDWQAYHYKVVLRRPKKQLTTYFSMGIAHTNEPGTGDVLDCLASDVAGYENARNFEEWAADYGYDEDSRKAERIFNTIGDQSKRLKKFLGDDLYEELLWETERL